MSKAVLGMKTPAGDGTPMNDEAHLPGRVAFPINNTVTGSMPYETRIHAGVSHANQGRRFLVKIREVLRAFRAITLGGSG
jgi:hypothetical protein